MTVDIELDPAHRRFVELVWRRFRDTGRWPFVDRIERSLRRELDPKADLYAILRAIPSVVGYGRPGSDGAEAHLTPMALASVVTEDARQTLEDFFRVFTVCLERWQAVSPDEDARLCSGDLGELGFDEIRIRRTYLLLTDANLLTGGEGTYSTDNGQQYGWDQVIYYTINRYRDVASLDQYLELRRAEMIESGPMSPSFVPEGTPIASIVPPRYPRFIEDAPVSNGIFVVHGRDLDAKTAMFDFLRALGLDPREWEEWVARTQKGTPYTGEVLDVAFAEAQAFLVLMTPDDLARAQPHYVQEGDQAWEREDTGQARANVLFEAGMAFGRRPERTIIVEMGNLRPFSDVGGRNVIRMDDSMESRRKLRARLKTAQCPINEETDAWRESTPFPKR